MAVTVLSFVVIETAIFEMGEWNLEKMAEQLLSYGSVVWNEQILNVSNLLQLVIIGLIFLLSRASLKIPHFPSQTDTVRI